MKIQWTEGRWFPVNVKAGALGAVDESPIYAGGMTHPWRESEGVWRYNEKTGDWIPAAPLPLGRCYTKGTTCSRGLVVVGGRKTRPGVSGTTLGDTWLLECADANLKWKKLPNLNTSRAECALAAIGSRIVTAGGGNWEVSKGGAFTADNVKTVEILDLNDAGSGWQQTEFPYTPRSSCAAAAVGNKFALFGGYACHVDDNNTRTFEYFDDVLAFDPVTGNWTELPSLPFCLSGHDAVALDDTRVLLFGGCVRYDLCGHTMLHHTLRVDQKIGVIGGYSNLVWMYDTESGKCEAVEGAMPEGLNDLRVCRCGETFWAVGGESVDTTTSNTSNTVAVGEIIQ